MHKNSVCYSMNVHQQKFIDRLKVAWRLLIGQPTTFRCDKAGIYHTNRNVPVTEIEL